MIKEFRSKMDFIQKYARVEGEEEDKKMVAEADQVE